MLKVLAALAMGAIATASAAEKPQHNADWYIDRTGDNYKCVALHNLDITHPADPVINGDYPSTPDAFVTKLRQTVGRNKVSVSLRSEGKNLAIVELRDWSDPITAEIGSAVVVFPMILGLERCRSLMGDD